MPTPVYPTPIRTATAAYPYWTRGDSGGFRSPPITNISAMPVLDPVRLRFDFVYVLLADADSFD